MSQFNQEEVVTPSIDVWLLATSGYSDKMDAYKAGIAAAVHGAGVYVLPVGNKWTWVAGVYQNESDANEALKQDWLPTEATIELYQITSKKFQVASEACEPCRQVLTTVKKIYQLLIELRTTVVGKTDRSQILHGLIREYNKLKSGTDRLQTLNATIQEKLIATLIYMANQNILGLQEIVCADVNTQPNLATLNTALLMTIFSLDNF